MVDKKDVWEMIKGLKLGIYFYYEEEINQRQSFHTHNYFFWGGKGVSLYVSFFLGQEQGTNNEIHWKCIWIK